MRLSGAGGADTLIGGAGDDVLAGGPGDDLYLFDADAALGTDTLIELSAGGDDLLDFSQTTTLGITLDLASAAVQVVNANLMLKLSAGDVFEMVVGTSLGDTILGNGLSNVLIGGAGNDSLSGRAGRDLLVGGTGADSLLGGDDDDLLIAGIFSYFNESKKTLTRSAIDALMAEWRRLDADHATRVAHLRGGGGLNGGTRLTAATVLTDGTAIDSLFGEAGLDWFWRFANDTVADAAATELFN